MKSILILLDSVVSIYIWILIINAILSWLIAFSVLNTSNRLVYSLLDISYKLTDPLLRPIRNFYLTWKYRYFPSSFNFIFNVWKKFNF